MAKNIQFELRPDTFDNFKHILNYLKENKEVLDLNREDLQTLGSVRDELDRAYYQNQGSKTTTTSHET